LLVDTNKSCTVLVVDNWLQFDLPDETTGKDLLAKIVELRLLRDHLLSKKLGEKTSKATDVMILYQRNLLTFIVGNFARYYRRKTS
jgi:hypothetical protein